MSAVVDMAGVTRTYGAGRTAVTAVADVSLRAEPGELLAVMGASGSGKTTLLALAGGLDTPTAGRVEVDGVDLAALGPPGLAELRRRRVGYVFQELNLVPSLTAAENVALPLELDGARPRAARRTALGALGAVGLDGLAERFPDDLSGGEQQRVAIARAVVGERRLILADEPTGALDSLTGEAVMGLLREHATGDRAGIVVTHEARHAAWADRVLFLRDGRLVDQAGPVPGPERLLAGGGE